MTTLNLMHLVKGLIDRIYRIVKFGLSAGVVLFLYLLLINNYFKNVTDIIHADGVGYYDYLPSIFIRGDIDRKGKLMADNPELYKGVVGYPDYHGMKLNKYGCGTALLQAPFFAYALATTPLEGNERDGYQPPFHKQIFHAAIFYLLLSLLLLRATLERFRVRWPVVFLMQLLMGLGTSVTFYAQQDAAYSHIYSLFAVSAFLYFATAYFQEYRSRDLVLMLAALGLVVLARQMNGLIVLLLPFLAGGWTEFKQGVTTMLSNYKWLAVGLVLMFGLLSLQSIVWYLQVGEFVTYSYGKEGFNFDSPKIFKVLFSYQKGLFIYTPVLFIALSGVIWLFFQGKTSQAGFWLLFFAVQTYVLSSWWCWFLGCSYGMRSYIDIYPVFFIPFAMMLDRWRSALKYLLVVLSLLCIPLNVIQSYQYKFCIMDWYPMDESKYWDIFLRTDPKYIGIFFKPVFDRSNMHVVREYDLGDVTGAPGTMPVILEKLGDSVPDLSKVKVLQILFDSELNHDCDTKLMVQIQEMDQSKWYNWSEKSILHYREKSLGTMQRAQFPLLLNPTPASNTLALRVFAEFGNGKCPLENVTVLLWADNE